MEHMKLLILTGLFLFSTNGFAQVVGPDGRYWLENPGGQPVEMQVGTRFVKKDGHALPDHPQGLSWVVDGYNPSGAEILVLVSDNDSRVTDSANYELLIYLDNFRQPMEEYTRAQRVHFMVEGLLEAGFSKAKAKKIAGQLADPRYKEVESEDLLSRHRASKCEKALS
jgi:hypothetical protein